VTCGKPIRDRAGEPLPGVTCNLEQWHLGKCVQTWAMNLFDFVPDANGAYYSDLMAPPRYSLHDVLTEREALDWAIETWRSRQEPTVTPSEPSGSEDD
jgi:hypothetical protein